MAMNQDLPATDSAAVLHDLIGDDATATFENDPKFTEPSSATEGSSENIQNGNDRKDIQSQPDLKTRSTDDDDDEEYEDVDTEDDEDDEDDEDLDDDDELEDEDDEEDDEDFEDDDEDDDEDEDDEDEE